MPLSDNTNTSQAQNKNETIKSQEILYIVELLTVFVACF